MHAVCLWIYDFDLFRMRPAHLLVNFTRPCTDWLAQSRQRKWPPSHVSYSCRPFGWKARRVWFLAACPEHFCHSNPPITATQQPFICLQCPLFSSFCFYYCWIIVNSPVVLPLHHLEFGTAAPNLKGWNVLCTTTAQMAVFCFHPCVWGANLLWKPCRYLDILYSLSRALTPPPLINMWWITSDVWF